MRDRLMSLIENAVMDYIDYTDRMNEAGMIVDKVYEDWLADHLLANGVIVPPCKVGDTVWEIDSDNLFEEDFRVMETKVEKYFVGTRLGVHLIDNFGKTVFLTKEEAEQALKEDADNE